MENKNVRIEVKGKGGRFVPFGKDVPEKLDAFQAAKWYIDEVSKADYIAIPLVKRGNSRMNLHNGSLFVALYTKAQVLRASDAMESGKAAHSALKVVCNQVKVMNVEAMRVLSTFGSPVQMYETDLTKWEDIQPDAGCANAPYAREWEKIVAHALDGIWVGALKGVQVDVIVNPVDD